MWLATWAARSRVLRNTELAPPLWINRHPNPWVLSPRWYVNLFLQTSILETVTVRIGLKMLSSPLSPLGGECTLLHWWLCNLFGYTLSVVPNKVLSFFHWKKKKKKKERCFEVLCWLLLSMHLQWMSTKALKSIIIVHYAIHVNFSS